MALAFSIGIMILQAVAAVAYATQGDIRRFIYWSAAAALTTAVTF